MITFQFSVRASARVVQVCREHKVCSLSCTSFSVYVMFQSVQLFVHFHVCSVSAADSQAGYKWGESYHATQAKLVERERWSASQFCCVTFAGAVDVARFKESREIILRLSVSQLR